MSEITYFIYFWFPTDSFGPSLLSHPPALLLQLAYYPVASAPHFALGPLITAIVLWQDHSLPMVAIAPLIDTLFKHFKKLFSIFSSQCYSWLSLQNMHVQKT